MTLDVEDLRLAVYRSLADTGAVPSDDVLAERLGATRADIEAGLLELHQARHVVLDEAGAIVMAHPFATVPLGFSVMGRSTLWWGGCVWDSFAIPHLVSGEPEVLVATTCPACGRAHAWVVGRDGPPIGEQVAHFLVPVRSMWENVVYTCGNQRVFCDVGCLDRWLSEHDLERGHVADLATVWRLASRWYEGRLDRGYTRRDPAGAAEYLRSVGLTGDFWATSDR
jgi:hypothetical protein